MRWTGRWRRVKVADPPHPTPTPPRRGGGGRGATHQVDDGSTRGSGRLPAAAEEDAQAGLLVFQITDLLGQVAAKLLDLVDPAVDVLEVHQSA